MASRLIMDLHDSLQPLAHEFLTQCALAGIDIIITCTFRSPAEQDALYAQGRTKPGAKVTNAKAGESLHNFMVDGIAASRAFDVVPLRGGKCVWGTKGADLILWKKVGEIGVKLGLEWAGNWKSFKEFPHFQLP